MKNLASLTVCYTHTVKQSIKSQFGRISGSQLLSLDADLAITSHFGGQNLALSILHFAYFQAKFM